MDNPIVIKLKQKFLEFLEKCVVDLKNHPKFNLLKDNRHLHSKESKLAFSIFNYRNKIAELINDLDKVTIFIRRFPSRSYYEENEIDQLNYIKYHIEVFYHKIHTILEVMKLLINELYDIRLSEQDCHWNNLKNNSRIKGSNVSKIIEAYYKTFKQIITERHLNTHRAIFNDSKKNLLKSELNVYNISERIGFDLGEEFKKLKPKYIVDYQVKEYRKERIKFTKKATEIVKSYNEQFELVILLEFFRRIKETE